MKAKNKNIEIDQAIWKVSKPKIEYSLFTNYKDFKINKHIIPFYDFEHKFLNQMLTLIEKMFEGKENFSRAEMLESLGVYIKDHKKKLDISQRKRIFLLIKPCFEDSSFPENTRIPAWKILQNLPLYEDAEIWLCKTATIIYY